MSPGLRATQLLDPGSWCAIAFWLGVVLLAMALLASLLDWGELARAAAPGRPPRRRLAGLLAIGGLVLVVVALVEAFVVG